MCEQSYTVFEAFFFYPWALYLDNFQSYLLNSLCPWLNTLFPLSKLFRRLLVLQTRNVGVIFGHSSPLLPAWNHSPNGITSTSWLSFQPFLCFVCILLSSSQLKPPPFPLRPAINSLLKCLPWLKANSVSIFHSLRNYSWIQIYHLTSLFKSFWWLSVALKIRAKFHIMAYKVMPDLGSYLIISLHILLQVLSLSQVISSNQAQRDGGCPALVPSSVPRVTPHPLLLHLLPTLLTLRP